MKRKTAHILSSSLLLLSLTSCDYREISTVWYDTTDVRIAVDWSGFTKEEPSGMSVYCYPKGRVGETAPYIYLSNDITGVMARLPVGNYDILVFNQSVNEFGSMRFEDMDNFPTARAVLEDYVAGWGVKSGDGTVSYEPEWLAVDTYENFSVTNEMMKSTAVLTLHPENIIRTARIAMRVYGIDDVRSVRGSIGGMASSYTLSTGECGTVPVTHALENWSRQVYASDKTRGEIFTTFRTFGLSGNSSEESAESSRLPSDNSLSVSFLLVDNKTVCDYGYKVGDRIRSDEKKLTLALEIGYVSDEGQEQTLDADPDRPPLLPDVEPESSGGGFSATLDDWSESQEIDVPL